MEIPRDYPDYRKLFSFAKIRCLQSAAWWWMIPTKVYELIAVAALVILIMYNYNRWIFGICLAVSVIAYSQLIRRSGWKEGYQDGYEAGLQDSILKVIDYQSDDEIECMTNSFAYKNLVEEIAENTGKLPPERVAELNKHIAQGKNMAVGFVS